MAYKSDKTFYCERCGRTKRENEFYHSNNLTKYPEGVFTKCKACLTAHVDNWDPDTYLWILQEADVPYIPKEWNKLMASYAKDRTKVTGMTIIGRYLGKMQLKQYKDYRWSDTEFLQELQNNEIEQTMKRQGYSAAEIAEAINKGTVSIPEGEIAPPPDVPIQQDMFPENPFMSAVNNDDDEDDFESELTEEDKKFLRLKWGKLYKPEEWIKLEQLYNDMMNSYDIQEAGHIDTLKLICKTSLKANQLIDLGDIEGYQKMSKVYNDLMKSGKFTAAQNKAENGEAVDSISELVAMCEKDGFIPRFYIDQPNDKVDRVLEDLQRYTRTLVTEEMGLGNLIENAVKQIEEDKKKEEENVDDVDEDQAFEEDLFHYDEDIELTDEDYTELKQMEEELEDADADLMKKLSGFLEDDF